MGTAGGVRGRERESEVLGESSSTFIDESDALEVRRAGTGGRAVDEPVREMRR